MIVLTMMDVSNRRSRVAAALLERFRSFINVNFLDEFGNLFNASVLRIMVSRNVMLMMMLLMVVVVMVVVVSRCIFSSFMLLLMMMMRMLLLVLRHDDMANVISELSARQRFKDEFACRQRLHGTAIMMMKAIDVA